MDEKIPGDEAFENFLNNSSFPKGISVIFSALKEKMRSTVDLYKISLEYYYKLDKDDPFKKQLFNIIKRIFNNYMIINNQFDYILMEDEENDDDDNDN